MAKAAATKLATTMAKTPLDTLVQARYADAIAQGALLFTDSTVSLQIEQDVNFEVRYVPALAKKPSSKPREKLMSSDFVNPFLPFDQRLHVKGLCGSHQLLLNKYCVVPYHLLITTAEFRQQGEPLTESDFAAVLATTSSLSRPQIVFYNSGEESGASQPHKHMQLLPMPEYLDAPPTVSMWMRSTPELGHTHVSRDLPFAHFGVRLDSSCASPSGLTAAYSAALKELTSAYSESTSYNMILTSTALMLFPRRSNSWEGISINSLGFAGLVLCKTTAELDLVKQLGVLNLLANVGHPALPNASSATQTFA
ncbi:bifunctional AP-4-A phosphorylase/ADP sulfurylase [Kickxella alabastrina]|uniref:Bifunctional AP-4-A phosphorylase/ADP sulfurylase n=1 Tax=Kickxella alabastrina TaxID=61397 RepID=A0ACC1II32_9FUNG|nr:bifunctional AP-4-A phosphorylase/ADP sulfurylase [Kickxella alabastrina]